MCDLAVLLLHLLATVARLAGPGGARAVVAESVLVKHQLLILHRSRKRSPNLRPADRVVAGLCALLIRPGRLIRSAIVLSPSTFLRLHQALQKRKYRLLFSPKVRKKPGPKGPTQEVMAAVVDMKRRNPTWGCPRIAQQIGLAFAIPRFNPTDFQAVSFKQFRSSRLLRITEHVGIAGPTIMTMNDYPLAGGAVCDFQSRAESTAFRR